MMLSFNGLMGAMVFLCIGILLLAAFMTAVYPGMSIRHEKRKLTQSQGRSPAAVVSLMRLQTLIVLPIIGYAVGHLFYSNPLGAP